jgi:hypothetical protein
MKTGVYRLGTDKIAKRIQHPFYTRQGINPLDYGVSFNGITVLADNSYIVTRSGVGSDPNGQIPFDALLLFNNRDVFMTPISITGDGGESYNSFFKLPYSIASVPPTGYSIYDKESYDFLVSTLSPTEDTILRVRYITVGTSDFGTSYGVKSLPNSKNPPLSRGALYQAGRFKRPYGLAFATDATKFMFVTDQDSLYQFSFDGNEGVTLPGQTPTRYNKVTFGGTGTGTYQFNGIRGVGYANRIVYIADKGNGRICRYKLSSDFQ